MDKKPNTIDTTNPRERWRFKCPECGSTNWRVHNGTFGCRGCHATVDGLIEEAKDVFRPRDWFEFRGPYADEKGEESKPKGVDPYR